MAGSTVCLPPPKDCLPLTRGRAAAALWTGTPAGMGLQPNCRLNRESVPSPGCTAVLLCWGTGAGPRALPFFGGEISASCLSSLGKQFIICSLKKGLPFLCWLAVGLNEELQW